MQCGHVQQIERCLWATPPLDSNVPYQSAHTRPRAQQTFPERTLVPGLCGCAAQIALPGNAAGLQSCTDRHKSEVAAAEDCPSSPGSSVRTLAFRRLVSVVSRLALHPHHPTTVPTTVPTKHCPHASAIASGTETVAASTRLERHPRPRSCSFQDGSTIITQVGAGAPYSVQLVAQPRLCRSRLLCPVNSSASL